MPERTTPESVPGAGPGDDRIPEHSRGGVLDDAQPSARGPATPPRPAADVNRAYAEALLEGVVLPATRKDLIRHAKRSGERRVARVLRTIPDRRYSTIDEIGEELTPVQPVWAPQRRVPRPESYLPPGGPKYGM